MDRIEVAFRYDEDEQPVPLQFKWQRRIYPVEAVGRRWQEAGDLHILCMASGSQVYELVYDAELGAWFLGHRPPPVSAA